MSLLFGAALVVTVDRVEAPYAVLEWPSGALGDVPLGLLPPGVAEGERLRLTLRPRPGGWLVAADPDPFLFSPAGLVPLHDLAGIQPGFRYDVHFRRSGRPARRSSDRA